MSAEDRKSMIREFALGLGVDDVGFASVQDYNSPKSPKIEGLFPSARSMVVMAFKEASHCESPSPSIAMAGRLDLMEFTRGVNYKLTRFLEKDFHAKAMSAPVSYPMDMGAKTVGLVGEISLRHAALAAGLGSFGRHNLIIHPRLGARVIFSAVLTDLDLPPDPPMTEDLCTNCDICVEACPGGALDEEEKTDVMKCLRNSQPYGIGGAIGFWSKVVQSAPEEQKKLLRSEEFMRLYHAQMIGFQYFCFKCYTSCPIGQL